MHFAFWGIISMNINAQESLVQIHLVSSKKAVKPIKKDTVPRESTAVLLDTMVFNKPEFKPDPNKALIYSAILPGLGQFYWQKVLEITHCIRRCIWSDICDNVEWSPLQ